IQHYKKQMTDLALNLNFEKAAQVKKKLEYLENYQSKSVIVSRHLSNVDVFSIVNEDNVAVVNYLMVLNGTIVQTHIEEITTKVEETTKDILALTVLHLREIFNSTANEIILPFEIPLGGD